MRFKQIRDVVAHGADCHLAMMKLYQRLEHQADSSHARLLLHYMVDNQRLVRQHLLDYQAWASAEVLDTWFDNVADDTFIDQCNQIELPATMTVDDITEVAFRLERHLINLYQRLADVAPTTDSRQALVSMAERAEDRMHHFAQTVNRMKDL